MDTVFVLFLDNHIVGVYTSHRKATQTMITDTFRDGRKLQDYSFQFGTEFFTYVDADDNTCVYELMEITPDTRA